MAEQKPKRAKLVIDVWPKLIEFLGRHPMLGDTPEDVARFLIIDGLDRRERRLNGLRAARYGARAAGYLGEF